MVVHILETFRWQCIFTNLWIWWCSRSWEQIFIIVFWKALCFSAFVCWSFPFLTSRILHFGLDTLENMSSHGLIFSLRTPSDAATFFCCTMIFLVITDVAIFCSCRALERRAVWRVIAILFHTAFSLWYFVALIYLQHIFHQFSNHKYFSWFSPLSTIKISISAGVWHIGQRFNFAAQCSQMHKCVHAFKYTVTLRVSHRTQVCFRRAFRNASHLLRRFQNLPLRDIFFLHEPGFGNEFGLCNYLSLSNMHIPWSRVVEVDS